jgi:hypothetical protein
MIDDSYGGKTVLLWITIVFHEHSLETFPIVFYFDKRVKIVLDKFYYPVILRLFISQYSTCLFCLSLVMLIDDNYYITLYFVQVIDTRDYNFFFSPRQMTDIIILSVVLKYKEERSTHTVYFFLLFVPTRFLLIVTHNYVTIIRFPYTASSNNPY